MGCNSSSEKFSLKPQQKQKIEDNAKLTVNQADYYKTVATTIVPLVKNQMKMSELMRARAPLSSYFTSGEPVPVQITDSSRSMNDMLMDMQLSAFQNCKDLFAPEIAQMKNPGDKMKAENQVHSESDLHVATHALQLLEGIAKGEGSSPTPARPQNSDNNDANNTNNNNTNNNDNNAAAGPSTGESAGTTAGTSQVVLPNGKWDLAEGTSFYWSNEEQLFFHPPSGQFYDPHACKWYDPDNDEWYDGDMD